MRTLAITVTVEGVDALLTPATYAVTRTLPIVQSGVANHLPATTVSLPNPAELTTLQVAILTVDQPVSWAPTAGGTATLAVSGTGMLLLAGASQTAQYDVTNTSGNTVLLRHLEAGV